MSFADVLKPPLAQASNEFDQLAMDAVQNRLKNKGGLSGNLLRGSSQDLQTRLIMQVHDEQALVKNTTLTDVQ